MAALQHLLWKLSKLSTTSFRASLVMRMSSRAAHGQSSMQLGNESRLVSTLDLLQGYI